MKTIGFVGVSGSGKSYKAIDVAKKHHIIYIIDDGLLISGNRIVAGISAKREPTRVASVKRALFIEEAHRNDIKNAIAKEKPDTVLVLGTSDRMIEAICDKLDLPGPERFIRIEDVATEEEIKTAHKIRTLQGQHVIPVPTFEIKKDFSGYWVKAIKRLKKSHASVDHVVEEKSVVRPTFSYLGDYNIENKVITDICRYEAECADCVYKALQCSVRSELHGVYIKIDLSVYYGSDIQKCARQVVRRVKTSIEKYTAINVISVNIYVKELKR
jgi:ABC-type dipeptide/oligopeptide/nickel transport system ATPase component